MPLFVQIRKHIFSFLPLKDIKTTRLVCHEWNLSASELLVTMSQIRFSNLFDDPEGARLPERFIEDYRNGSLLKKFDKFCFNSPECSIGYEDIDNFVQEFGDHMKELTIFETNIRSNLYPLSRKNLIKLIPSNLTKLEIVSERVPTKLVISMKRLKNIKTLRLAFCILKIIDGSVCAPVELRLKNIFFLRNRKDYQKSVKLNDVFDLSNLKILQLDCSETGNICLDLSVSAPDLTMLVLDQVKLMNGGSSMWTVKKLTLCKQMKFSDTIGMKCEELDFSGASLDLATLPTSLKSLALRRYKTKILHMKAAENFVNLKYLIVQRKEFGLLTSFQSCVNLTHLHLLPVDADDEMATVDVNTIPKTLKVLRLSYNCELVGMIGFEIETVIIEHVPFGDAYDYFVENLKVKNAFLYCSDFEFETDDGTEIDEVVKELPISCFIVGPFLRSKTDRFSFFYFDENPTAEYLVKTSTDGGVVKKEIEKSEIDRRRNLWWIKDEITF